MKVSGFSFVRNGNIFAYPMKESILSMLPLCDEIIIAVGKSDDDTLETIKSLNESKIKIIETEWDLNNNKDGRIYSEQTNLAFEQCTGDWCLYLQADEVIHEKDYAEISKRFISEYENDKIDALLFNYKHFYGSYDYLGVGRQWYKREIRVIRNKNNITSWGDAQGFRKVVNIDGKEQIEKLKAKQINADIFHYGWVRPPKAQGLKIANANNYYHKDNFDLKDTLDNSNTEKLNFNYDNAFELENFKETHPKLMQNKIISDKNWTQYFDATKLRKKPMRHKITDKIEKITGYRIGEYRDFVLVK